MTLAIEILDEGLLVRSRPALTTDLPPSPGYALLEKGGLRTGAAALAAARLQPKQVDNQFWESLSTEPLAGARGDLSAADLAHAHLTAIWEQVRSAVPSGDSEVLLVLPGSYDDGQLGLALGIARACGIPVVGMVDAAVAAAAGSPGAPSAAPGYRHLLHLDLQLHNTVVTDLVRNGEVTRRSVEVIPRLGLVSLYGKWARRIAQAFVHTTRFDPLHGAATERDLYDRLPAFLQQLSGRDSASFRLEAGAKSHTVELARGDLTRAVDTELEAIFHLIGAQTRTGEATALLLSHRAASLPGLRQRLTEVKDAVVVDLPEGAAADAALAHAAHIRMPGEALPFVTTLPAYTALQAPTEAPVDPPPAVSTPAPSLTRSGVVVDDSPTHLLHEGRAHELTVQALVLGTTIGEGQRGLQLRGQINGISRFHCTIRREGDRVVVVDHSAHGTFVNGQRLDGQRDVVLGDRLRLGNPGLEFLLIRVEEG